MTMKKKNFFSNVEFQDGSLAPMTGNLLWGLLSKTPFQVYSQTKKGEKESPSGSADNPIVLPPVEVKPKPIKYEYQAKPVVWFPSIKEILPNWYYSDFISPNREDNSYLQNKRILNQLPSVYEFYAKDVYPRKQKYSEKYDSSVHNMKRLIHSPIYSNYRPWDDILLNRTLGETIPTKTHYMDNNLYVTPTWINTAWGKKDATLVHEATHAEDVDYSIRNGLLSKILPSPNSLDEEEKKTLENGYQWTNEWANPKTDIEKYQAMAERMSTNRQLRYKLSKYTGLTDDELTQYILDLEPKEFIRLNQKLGNYYLKHDMNILKEWDIDAINNRKKALIEVAMNKPINDILFV